MSTRAAEYSGEYRLSDKAHLTARHFSRPTERHKLPCLQFERIDAQTTDLRSARYDGQLRTEL